MKEKAWEILSHAVISGTQVVDTWGVVPYKESQSTSNVRLRLEARGFTRQHQYCSLFMTPWSGRHEAGISTVVHHSLCVYRKRSKLCQIMIIKSLNVTHN